MPELVRREKAAAVMMRNGQVLQEISMPFQWHRRLCAGIHVGPWRGSVAGAVLLVRLVSRRAGDAGHSRRA